MTTIELADGTAGLRQYLALNVDMRTKHKGMSMLDAGYAYVCMEDFVLKEGEIFMEFSPHQPKLGQKNRYRPRMPRQCFANAYKAALASKGRLRYVEGYAYGGFLPVLHAWNIDPDGKIVDTTWCGDGEDLRAFTRPKPGSAYMGVIFPIEYVRSQRTPDNTSMIDAWERNWSLLRKPYKEVIA